jgi:hypothetical protein
MQITVDQLPQEHRVVVFDRQFRGLANALPARDDFLTGFWIKSMPKP